MNKSFHTAQAKCKKCRQIITSIHGGHFVTCDCGASYIDQERWSALYVRYGGDAEGLGQVCPEGCDVPEHKKD